MDCERDFSSRRALQQHINNAVVHQDDSDTESEGSDISEAASWVTEESSDEEVNEIERMPPTALFRCTSCSHGFTSQEALLTHYSVHATDPAVKSEPVSREVEKVTGFDMLARYHHSLS
jgi:hypothetical protein